MILCGARCAVLLLSRYLAVQGACPPGQYSAGSGCNDCPAGHYTERTSSANICTLCPVGLYAAALGNIACTACASGLSAAAGASSCGNCAVYTVVLSDTFSDGWSGSELHVGDFAFTMVKNGDDDSGYDDSGAYQVGANIS